ncbi:MAG: formate dehydrogenase accessory sulfurtransferase FdhD [Planctomycetes bacterium]|nr:formate dehydrogenase accessory sulfurtransferase FdhD [Planctomycetota bacterium]
MSEPGRDPLGAARRRLHDESSDQLVREEPLWIEVCGHRLLTMRTPGRDADLAIGFLLGEGVIDDARRVASAEEFDGDPQKLVPDTVRITLHDPTKARIEGRLTRTHEIRPSCGLCGLVDADQLLDEFEPLLPGVPKLPRNAVDDRRKAFVQTQPLFAATGACHGAVLFGPDGVTWSSGEDVGRHNALDKAIGSAARAGRPLAHATAMLSGRAGFDLVLKCLRVRIPVILAVSAPSALAFDLCRTAGATLIGFVREGRARVYCDSGRLQDE